MKRILLLLTLALLVAACGPRETPEDQVVISEDASRYQVAVGSSDLAPGRSRLVLLLWDGPERLSGVENLELALFTLSEDGTGNEKIWEGAGRGYPMASGGDYWVFYPEFPAEGFYGAQVRFTDPEGRSAEALLTVGVKPEPDAPAIGEAAPPSDTPTLDDVPLEQLSSGEPRVPAFYELSIAEAAASGRPSVIVFATPAFCTSRLCGPVMESVREASEQVGDGVNVVHVEVFPDGPGEPVAPSMGEWNLVSEPWVFVLDDQGRVAARLDGPISTEELVESIDEVTGG